MKIGDKVYVIDGGRPTPGIIVARRWSIDVLPKREYIVKKSPIEGLGITAVIAQAFNGSSEDLVHTDGQYLIRMPQQKESGED